MPGWPRLRKLALVATVAVVSCALCVVLSRMRVAELERGWQHRRLTPSISAGAVRVTYDPELKAMAKVLAADGAAAVPIMAGLLGGRVPEGRSYTVNAYADPAEFQAKLGRAENDSEVGGRSSPETGQAYVHWWLRHGPEDSRDLPAPFIHRDDFLHELSHLIAYDLYPEAKAMRWPFWLTEGLAQLASRAALAQRSADQARTFDDYKLALWRQAADHKGVPASGMELLRLSKEAAADLAGAYASAYFLLRQVQQQGHLPELLRRIAAGLPVDRALAEVAGDPDRLWQAVRAQLAAQKRPPFSWGCSLDRIGEAYRVHSRVGLEGRMILTDRTYSAVPVLEASFALWPTGSRQADIYLRYHPERDDDHFKLAIVADAVRVFRRQPGGNDQLVAEAALAKPVEAGDDGLLWHRVKVTWAKALVVTIDGRSTQLQLSPPSSQEQPAFQLALGAHDGITYFKDIVVDGVPK